MKHLFISNKELRRILGVSEATISRAANGKTKHTDALRNIRPIYVGEARRWRVADVANALGIAVADIDEILN